MDALGYSSREPGGLDFLLKNQKTPFFVLIVSVHPWHDDMKPKIEGFERWFSFSKGNF